VTSLPRVSGVEPNKGQDGVVAVPVWLDELWGVGEMIATSETIAKKQRAFMAEILFQVLYNCREQAITLIRRRANSRIVGLRSAEFNGLSFARGSPRRSSAYSQVQRTKRITLSWNRTGRQSWKAPHAHASALRRSSFESELK